MNPSNKITMSCIVLPLASLNPYQTNWKTKALLTGEGSMHTYKNARGEGCVFNVELTDEDGKKLAFVTNNSTKSRRQYAQKYQSLGIPVTEEEIFSSSFAAAMYLKVNKFPQEKKVYLIGGDGILEEVKLAGFTRIGGLVGAVVVGQRELTKGLCDSKIHYFPFWRALD